jgi:ATP-dependent DNA helicase RecG
LNKDGGGVLVGMHDFGKPIGINEMFLDSILNKLSDILKRFFSPAVENIVPEVLEVEQKKIIYLDIPYSAQVYRYKNKVYDRIGDEIYDVTYTYNLVGNIYLRKKKESSENIVYPFLRMRELDDAAFHTMRQYLEIHNPNHRWLSMTNEEILHDAGFWRKDPLSDKEGFTLGAVLLFGKEVTIQNYCPSTHRTDAVYRDITYSDYSKPLSDYPESKYDDRDIIFSNLIDSYIRLTAFAERTLPSRTINLDGNPVDIRKIISNELITNFLVHREYTQKYPNKLSVFSDKIITENGTNPLVKGDLTIDTLEPYSKNPLITRVFQEIGWIDQAGSGRNNIKKYAAYYDKTCTVEIQNGEKFVFTLSYGNEGLKEGEILPLHEPKTYQGWPMYSSRLFDVCPDIDISYIEKAESILEACVKPRPIQEMMQIVRQSNRTRFRQNIIRPLLDQGLLAMRIPTKPSSPLQKYFTTEKGKALL